jgi:hypothetical protein
MKTRTLMNTIAVILLLIPALASAQSCPTTNYQCSIGYFVEDTEVIISGTGPTVQAAQDNFFVDCVNQGLDVSTCRSYEAQAPCSPTQ